MLHHFELMKGQLDEHMGDTPLSAINLINSKFGENHEIRYDFAVFVNFFQKSGSENPNSKSEKI